MRLLAIFVTILLAGCAAPTPEPAVGSDEPADGTGAISGLLVDDRFHPIPGAHVILNELQLETQTNDGGEFGFTNIATSSDDDLQTPSPFDANQPFSLHWQPISPGATPETSGAGVHVAVTADITITLVTGGLDPNTICNSC